MPSATPLALLHPFPLDAGFWDAVAPALAAGRPLLRPDFPGLGAAAARAGAGVDDAADEVAGLIGREAPEGRAAVCGLSLGGYVALSLAARHPGRVAALVLADTRAEADAPEQRRGRLDNAARVRAEGLDGFLDALLPGLVAPGADAALADVRRIAARQAPEGVAAVLEALAARTDRVADLPAIAVPTLVVVGEDDGLTPPRFSETLAEAIPHAELVVIPGAGHLSAIERPERFAAAVTGFLARRLPG